MQYMYSETPMDKCHVAMLSYLWMLCIIRTIGYIEKLKKNACL